MTATSGSRRLIGMASVALCCFSALPRAQEVGAAIEWSAPVLGTVEVLGSHIRRVDVETQHPVFTIDRAEIVTEFRQND